MALTPTIPSRTSQTSKLSAIALFVTLAALYFLTYSGHEISADELILFDGVHSLAQHGNLWLAYLNTERPPGTYPDNAPVPSLDSEPMQVLVALPLFWIAQVVPGIGLMQTVWLLNIVLTALTAVVLFYYGLTLGYSARIASGVALLFGTATMAWPYSKTFFREPLFTLLALICAYCLERWRREFAGSRFRIGWLVGAGVALLGTLLAKDAAVFFIPVFVVVGLPPLKKLQITRRGVLIGLAASVIFGGAAIVGLHFVASGRYDVISRIVRIAGQGAQIPYALAGYWLSLGRSWWMFSPVLLLGIWGILRLRRQGRWRELAVPAVALVTFTIGYAVFQNADWYGGLAWGPRYLLPVIPFLSLLLLPVLDGLAQVRRFAQIGAGLLIVLSVGVQLLGTLIPVNDYYAFLGAENTRLGLPQDTINGWQAGTWELNYIPATVLVRLALNGRVTTDLAWQVNGAVGIALVCGAIIVGGVVVLWVSPALKRRTKTGFIQDIAAGPNTPRISWRGKRTTGERILSFALMASLLIVIGLGLFIYRADPRYGGGDPSLRAGLDTLNANLQPGDAVILNDGAYRPFFMNYYKATVPIFLLPDSWGEVSVPGKPPQVTSTNLDDLVMPITVQMLPRISLFSQRWWFVTEFIPPDTTRTRATEHFLTRHYFPVHEVFTANTLRVIEFSAHSAPPDSIPPWPAARSNAQFGHLFTLVGYDPAAPTITPGQVLTLSLMWRFDGWPAGQPPFDYSVNVSLIDATGATVPGAQYSGTPLGTFGRTSQWQAGGYYRDNYGLNVPTNLAPGTYHIWVLWYDWRNGSRLSVNGADHLDLLTIQVR